MPSSADIWIKPINDTLQEDWLIFLPFIHKVLEHDDGRYTAELIKQRCDSLHYQLWGIYAKDVPIAVVVTEIVCYTSERRLRILFLAGIDFDSFKHCYQPISDWARQLGCTCTEIHGRPGWGRKLKYWNIKPLSSVYKMDLCESGKNM